MGTSPLNRGEHNCENKTGKMKSKKKKSFKPDTRKTDSTDLRLTLHKKAADKHRRSQLTENLRQFLNKSNDEPKPTIDLRNSMKRKITSSTSQDDVISLKQKYSGLSRTVTNSLNVECSEVMNQESQNSIIVPFQGVHCRVRKSETGTSITEQEKGKESNTISEVVVVDDEDDDDIEILDDISVHIPSIGLEPIMVSSQSTMSNQLLEIRGRKRES